MCRGLCPLCHNPPLSLPLDVKRFFITREEAGIICLFSALLGENNQIFFPYNNAEIKLTSFKTIAANLLSSLGKEAVFCSDENQSRKLMQTLDLDRFWPVNSNLHLIIALLGSVL